MYTGLEIKQASHFIALSQIRYIDQISEIEIDPARIRHNDLDINDAEKGQLCSVCGQLLWVSTQSRPDVSYATCVASNALASGTISDLKLVNKTVKFLKNNPLTVRFSAIDDISASLIVVFSDASYANLPGACSQGGHIILMVSRSGKFCPLSWQSKKIRRVCKSTLAAESWAMVEAVECADFVNVRLKKRSGEILDFIFNFYLKKRGDCESLYNILFSYILYIMYNAYPSIHLFRHLL